MSLLDSIADVGNVLSGNVRATLESNIAPPIQVYGGAGADNGASIAAALGIRAGVVVRDPSGRVIARLGDPAAFEPLRAALLALGVVGAVVALVMVAGAVRRAAR